MMFHGRSMGYGLNRRYCLLVGLALSSIAMAKRPALVEISMEEAIQLALRDNPTLVNARIGRLMDKFDLQEAEERYTPQLSTYLNGSIGVDKYRSLDLSIDTSVSMKTFWGTRLSYSGVSLDRHGDVSGGYFSMTQPLLKGAGYEYNRFDLETAYENEERDRLSYKETIMRTIDQVVQAYRRVMQQENALRIQGMSLVQSTKVFQQYEMKVKHGDMARSNLSQQNATLFSARLRLQDAKNRLQDEVDKFLSLLGLAPGTKIILDDTITIDAVELPEKEEAIQKAMKANISWLKANLSIHSTERSLVRAKDNLRPQLDLTASASPQGSFGPVKLNFRMPLDNFSLKKRLAQARINLKQAQVRLEQQRKDLETRVETTLYKLKNQKIQLGFAEEKVKLQEVSYKAKLKSQEAGFASTYEVSSMYDQLVSSRVDLVNRKISYLNAIDAFHNLLGDTIEVHHLKLSFDAQANGLEDLEKEDVMAEV